MHYDNPGPPNQRRLTCIVYLNPRYHPGKGVDKGVSRESAL